MRNQLKMAVAVIGILIAGVANAQQTSGNIARKDKGNLTGKDRTVRVIDNKGTIKYLQVTNGITTLTNETNGKTVTTWQLGGALTTSTIIGTTKTNTLSINGGNFILGDIVSATGAAATSTSATKGWTVLVRDQADGKVKNIAITDLLKVQSVHMEFEVSVSSPTVDTTGSTGITGSNTTASNTTTASTITTVQGLTDGFDLEFATDKRKVMVYRNGAKLIAGRDYTVAPSGKVSKLTITPNSNPNSIHYWTINEEDFFEIHYTK